MRVELRPLAFALTLAAGFLIEGAAFAQSDPQTYRGGGATVITSPALGGGTSTAQAGGGSLSGDVYSRLDERINALESQLRDLTGQLEKSNFELSQLTAKVERMRADNELRFKDLESKSGGGAPAAAAKDNPPPANSGAEMGTAPGFLGKPGQRPQGGQQQAAASPPPATQLAGRTPQEKYDTAFTMLRNSDYDAATKAFQAFVAQYPTDPLAGNAMYWLGQIPYSQGEFQQAAVTFLDAYRKYPKSAKAGESLLKVGLSMGNLGKKKESCAALQRFTSEFPDAADNLKRQAVAEKQKQGC